LETSRTTSNSRGSIFVGLYKIFSAFTLYGFYATYISQRIYHHYPFLRGINKNKRS
jgi:hypothetical protein